MLKLYINNKLKYFIYSNVAIRYIIMKKFSTILSNDENFYLIKVLFPISK